MWTQGYCLKHICTNIRWRRGEGEEVRGEEEESSQGEVCAWVCSHHTTGEGADGGLRETFRLHACGRLSCGAASPRAHGSGEDRWVRGADVYKYCSILWITCIVIWRFIQRYPTLEFGITIFKITNLENLLNWKSDFSTNECLY